VPRLNCSSFDVSWLNSCSGFNGGYSGESCENESGELGERREYFAEQRTCQFNIQTFIILVVLERNYLLKGLSVERVHFIRSLIAKLLQRKYSAVRCMLRRSGYSIRCSNYCPNHDIVFDTWGENDASSSNITVVTNICVQVLHPGHWPWHQTV